MDLIIFILVYPLIWLLSILPMRVLYALSDFIYLILYYLIGYRKKVVRYNLEIAFPDKTPKERLKIEKLFFRHFVDIFMEMIKSFTISQKEISKRFVFKNIEILDEFIVKEKSLIIMAGHYANWEWVVHFTKISPLKGYAAFKKVKNKYFDDKIKSSRTKFGAHFIPTVNFKQVMEENVNDNVLAAYGLLSDQTPRLKKTHYWGTFFGVEVPVHTGAEMLAKKYNFPVIYFNTKRVKRGYYESTIEVLAKKPRLFSDYEITDLFLKKLEKQIKDAPEFYFWTHKRFKHLHKNKKVV